MVKMVEETPEEVAARLRKLSDELATTPDDIAQRLRVMAFELKRAAERLERYARESGVG